MANFHLSVTLPSGPPVWRSGDDLAVLQKEAVALIEEHGQAFVRLIVNGKVCRVSRAVQTFYMENPEEGKPPVPLASPAPSFDDAGFVECLVPRPKERGD